MKKTLIIIPTYNESKNIEKIVNQIFEKFCSENINILVVDSSSTDGTAEIVMDMQKKFSNLYLIQQKQKEGLASAYIEGMKWALNQSYDIVIQMDADFQHPIEALPDMIESCNDYDLVIGSRYVNGGAWAEDKWFSPKSRISKLGSLYSRIVLNCPIKDLTGGYNAWTKKALSLINFDEICAKGYMFQIEMKYKTYKNNMRILEYPIKFFPRKEGKSKMDLKIIFEALFQIWKLRNVSSGCRE